MKLLNPVVDKLDSVPKGSDRVRWESGTYFFPVPMSSGFQFVCLRYEKKFSHTAALKL